MEHKSAHRVPKQVEVMLLGRMTRLGKRVIGRFFTGEDITSEEAILIESALIDLDEARRAPDYFAATLRMLDKWSPKPHHATCKKCGYYGHSSRACKITAAQKLALDGSPLAQQCRVK